MTKRRPGNRAFAINSEALRQAREAKFLEMRELAASARISKRRLEQFETQGGNAFKEVLRRLAEALDVEPKSLLLEPHLVKESSAASQSIKDQVRTPDISHATVVSLIGLSKEFAGSRMELALDAVWNHPLEDFENDAKHRRYRRVVLHFWETIAMLAKSGGPELQQALLSRYKDHVSVWKRLKQIQINHQMRIIRQNRPKLPDADVKSMAIRDVSKSPVEWLYNQWKSHRSETFRD